MAESEDVEERIATLQEENEELKQRLEKIETTIQAADQTEDEDDGGLNISRRGAMTGLAGIGALGIGATGTAAAETGTSAIISDGSGQAVYADNTAGSGKAYGVNARSKSADGIALRGIATDSGSGLTKGVEGETFAERGRGVLGISRSSSGPAYGVYGISESSDGIGLFGRAKSDTGQTSGLRGLADSPNGKGVSGFNNAASGTTIGVYGSTNSSDGYGLYSGNNAKVEGNLEVTGTKNFVQAVETPSGQKEVTYNAVEAGRVRTEATGTVEIDDGRVEVELPDHFSMVTSEDEEISVHLTPHAETKAHPQVVECTTEQLIVEDFSGEADEYSLSYTVKGIREGFEDKEIVGDLDDE